ncbi:MAG TPA: ABC transporter substrate-binding protein [Candidatus Polarisedimenticolia bacterium]|nr:ABC transporter substrate-binding protein [Candidatus Polarisedimenticolia bacterium]
MTLHVRRAIQAALICLIVLTEMLPAFSDAPVTIAVVLSRDAAPYRQALRGFQEVLEESGRTVKLHELVMDGGGSNPEALAAKIRARRPDLILTIGSGATHAVSSQIRDIPIVFSLVLPSSGSESLQGLRESRGNLTGASMEIPLRVQFGKLKQVLPEVRKVGVLFNPAVTGPMVDNASETAASMGLELVALPVTSEKDLVEISDDLDERVDVLWSVADSTVFSPQGLKQVLLATLRNRIPFVGLSPSFVKAGALLAFSVDYQDVGRQSAEQALRVLAGEEPTRVPMSVPRSISLSLNMNTARQIEVHIEDSIRQKAELFF